jgi:hypothetical protein
MPLLIPLNFLAVLASHLANYGENAARRWRPCGKICRIR